MFLGIKPTSDPKTQDQNTWSSDFCFLLFIFLIFIFIYLFGCQVLVAARKIFLVAAWKLFSYGA